MAGEEGLVVDLSARYKTVSVQTEGGGGAEEGVELLRGLVAGWSPAQLRVMVSVMSQLLWKSGHGAAADMRQPEPFLMQNMQVDTLLCMDFLPIRIPIKAEKLKNSYNSFSLYSGFYRGLLCYVTLLHTFILGTMSHR